MIHNDKKNNINLFFVKTELEVLSSEIIAEKFYPNDFNALLYRQNESPKTLSDPGFSLKQKINFKKSKGILKKYKGVLFVANEIVDLIENQNTNPKKITLFLSKITSGKVNYFINYLIRRYPRSKVSVNLIPHGTVNFYKKEISLINRLKGWRRILDPRFLFTPGLNYYVPKGDWIGGLDPIVKKIYTLPDAPCPYPNEKIRRLPPFHSYFSSKKMREKSTGNKRRALIIGQPVIDCKMLSLNDERTIREKMNSWLREHGVEEIFYSRHPRSKTFMDFHEPEYTISEQEGSALEYYLANNQFHFILSCYSTALYTAKLISDPTTSVISFGLNLVQLPLDVKISLISAYENIGIRIHDA